MYINEDNFLGLWQSLKEIEKKSFDISRITYEQGKLLENVYWTGSVQEHIYENPFEHEFSYSEASYRLLSKKQLSFYLYWRTSIRGDKFIKASDFYYKIYATELIAKLGMTDSGLILNRLNILKENARDKRFLSKLI